MTDTETDLPTFLLWVAESYEAHAATSTAPDEIEGYLGSAKMARDHLARLSASPKGDDLEPVKPVAWQGVAPDGEVGLTRIEKVAKAWDAGGWIVRPLVPADALSTLVKERDAAIIRAASQEDRAEAAEAERDAADAQMSAQNAILARVWDILDRSKGQNLVERVAALASSQAKLREMEKALEAAEVAWRASVHRTCKGMLTDAFRAYFAALRTLGDTQE